ncbi:hypothetical protein SERLA73DRAFT_185351 [Serpula lacrymans var. lacrymans S7.3]|uniref:Carnitine/acyl carnitine carrier n=2 Tax=Serpula lacrymans var. lacrymans TaxID=341189 RepID=F8Q4L6_SERL3|nr:uncharacterized protein SERLADRAFT_473790 [Serpula lacrymans var. lacrymans S7.9]EGN97071.1 hypothetical protein SERLA73DRAFT_185351 [Serpula lacrymans var. lacrymans S7.3]EGO22673.1 hypothetical protein SERLADRAFT_473790 [Serpula lacrymans var. lacrymans S7.9]
MSSDQTSGKSKAEIHPTIDFVAGTVAGIAGIIVGYPFDTVKVRFQNPAISSKYHSTFNAFNTIVREERFLGLYKGVVSPLATCAFLNGLVFASYKLFMRGQLESETTVPTLTQITLAGAGSGIISSLITTPTELIKIKQQNTMTVDPANASARAIALRIYRQNGIRGLYRGITTTALRDCGYGAYFTAYEATCRYFASPVSTASSDHSSIFSEIESEMSSLSLPAFLAAGGVAGIAGWITTFPFDVVKTRIQSSDYTPSSSLAQGVDVAHHNPYRTTMSAFMNSYRAEGMSVFFRGLAPTLIRAIPVNMATFAVFESAVHVLS